MQMLAKSLTPAELDFSSYAALKKNIPRTQISDEKVDLPLCIPHIT